MNEQGIDHAPPGTQATRGDGVVLCGNSRHPNGPWHRATPLPLYPGFVSGLVTRQGRILRREIKRYDQRRELWGCGCFAAGMEQ